MNQEITYSWHGDYLLPDIRLSEPLREELPSDDSTWEKYPPIGRFGRMRRAFLKEHRPIEYSRLLLTEQLFPHLREVDAIANQRRKNGVPKGTIVKEIVCEV
jgi:hypothetical protein